MKKCEPFKDLILTDYIDGQLNKDQAGNLENHLLDCRDCRAFLNEVKNNTKIPFQQSPLQPVPVGLWDSIKQGIEQEGQGTSPLSDLIEKIKGLVVFPRLVPVFASLVLMLLAGSMTLNTVNIRQEKDRDQGEYLVSLLSPADTSALPGNNSGGTPIEHYFL